MKATYACHGATSSVGGSGEAYTHASLVDGDGSDDRWLGSSQGSETRVSHSPITYVPVIRYFGGEWSLYLVDVCMPFQRSFV